MKRVRQSDTVLELTFRRALWAHGLRYRIHLNGVEGKPDLGLRGRRVAVFIDGCFWHGCPTCKNCPATNHKFWVQKFQYNRERRVEVKAKLERMGWTVVEVWGHEIERNLDVAVDRVASALQGSRIPANHTVSKRHRLHGKGRKV
jgi:DNA mismatch endonuclease (patch repair protein)